MLFGLNYVITGVFPGSAVIKKKKIRLSVPEKQGTRVPSLGREDPLGEETATYCSILGASLVAPTVKNLPVTQDTGVSFLSREDLWSLGNPMDRRALRATVHRVTKSRHD